MTTESVVEMLQRPRDMRNINRNIIIVYLLRSVNLPPLGDDMNLYDNIKEIADRKGLSIREVERRASLGNSTVRKWNDISPSVENLIKVAKVLKVKPNRLLK